MFGFTNLPFVVLAVLPALVKGHAEISSPPIRTPGAGLLAACGQASVDEITKDPTGHIEDQEPFLPGCEPTLCRGMVFEDQPAANVQEVSPGEAMAMAVACSIPHGGPANVSLIDTTAGGTGAVIGTDLATFDDFCPVAGPTPADQTNLEFTLPGAADVGTKCQKPGDCVVQLFWATPDLSQNYYYCVDVTMGAAAGGAAAPAAGDAAAAAPAAGDAATAAPAAAAPAAAPVDAAAAAPAKKLTGAEKLAAKAAAKKAAAVAAKREFRSRINTRQVKKPYKARGTNVFGKFLGATN